MTLKVDLKKTDRELSQYITTRCSDFGNVRSVTIHRDPTPFALVVMTNRMETLELAGQYGGSSFGGSALIHLEQESTM
jgi:hypothetical protein